MSLFGPSIGKIDKWRSKGAVEKIINALTAEADIACHALTVLAEDDPERTLERIATGFPRWRPALQLRAVELLQGPLAPLAGSRALINHLLAAATGEPRQALLNVILNQLANLSRRDLDDAMRALEQEFPEQAADLLAEMLGEETKWRRQLAIKRLASFTNQDRADEILIDWLMRAVADEDVHHLRGNARSSLRALLMNIAETGDVAQRCRAIGRIADLGWKDQVPKLALWARIEPDEAVRTAAGHAVDSLGGLGRDGWVALLRSDQPQLSQEAMRHLLLEEDWETRDLLFAGKDVPLAQTLTAYWEMVQSSRGEAADHLCAWPVTGLDHQPHIYAPVVRALCSKPSYIKRMMNPALLNAVASLSQDGRSSLDVVLIQTGHQDLAERYYDEIDGMPDSSAVIEAAISRAKATQG